VGKVENGAGQKEGHQEGWGRRKTANRLGRPRDVSYFKKNAHTRGRQAAEERQRGDREKKVVDEFLGGVTEKSFKQKTGGGTKTGKKNVGR